MIKLTLPYPISANVYWRSYARGGRAIVTVSKEAEQYRSQVNLLCWQAGIREPIQGRVAITVQLFPQRPLDWAKRARKDPDGWDNDVRCIDLDNANKVLLDALKDVAIEDDKWVRRIVAERMEPDDKGARVVVTIEAIRPQQAQAAIFEAEAA
ncbi:RusA family crossover junction endodeoxyribonuclease [Paucibacter sp. KBW04]|uniref:RusA family crossover junction endodeoxyribonuclease n=1 Tax=Paucibacter sp. KBW04 TaxID=2153361 RepID=UPI000F57D9DE|nr:RusA family crossover junction endodeoxyribonuclease [Paucibacter sp. KBW04]RQO57984.1 RusA family crossover junction endodeoxyribonuclease [Paucibacter sp. KBW04]